MSLLLLPLDLIKIILSNLSHKDLLQVVPVCHFFYRMSTDQEVWRFICQIQFKGEYDILQKSQKESGISWKEIYFEESYPMKWDEQSALVSGEAVDSGKRIFKLSERARGLIHSSPEYHLNVRTTRPLSLYRKQHIIEFTYDKIDSYSVCVGVMEERLLHLMSNYDTIHGGQWLLWNDGYIADIGGMKNGIEFHASCLDSGDLKIRAGDIIGIYLDRSQGLIGFFKNGKPCGSAHLIGSVPPHLGLLYIVCYLYGDDELRILDKPQRYNYNL